MIQIYCWDGRFDANVLSLSYSTLREAINFEMGLSIGVLERVDLEGHVRLALSSRRCLLLLLHLLN